MENFELNNDMPEISPDENTETSLPEIEADVFGKIENTELNELPEEENKETDKQEVKIGSVLQAETVLNVANVILPSLIVFAFNRFGYATDKRQFKLSADEKNIIQPVLQDCLNYVSVSFSNPFYTLGFVLSMIYGSKILDAIQETSKTAGDETSNDDIPEGMSSEAKRVREKIDATSIRKEKTGLTIQYIIDNSPTDLIEAYKYYAEIFPERSETYFRTWYERNLEAFPEHLRFINSDGLQ